MNGLLLTDRLTLLQIKIGMNKNIVELAFAANTQLSTSQVCMNIVCIVLLD